MVDIAKKSNRKCEHCELWNRADSVCKKSGEKKNYWNCCKAFQWRADLVTDEAKKQLALQHIRNEEASLKRMRKNVESLKKQLEESEKACVEQELKIQKMKQAFEEEQK